MTIEEEDEKEFGSAWFFYWRLQRIFTEVDLARYFFMESRRLLREKEEKKFNHLLGKGYREGYIEVTGHATRDIETLLTLLSEKEKEIKRLREERDAKI